MTRRLRNPLPVFAVTALLAGAAVAAPANAQVAISANDNKVVRVNGVETVVANPAPDNIAIIDLRAFPPRIAAEVQVPTSVAGPPLSVAITPDERLALVTQAFKKDPADPTKQVHGSLVSVIDLTASPPAVMGQLETGRGPSGVSINRRGDLALVANRFEGTVSVLGIDGKSVTHLGKVRIGDEQSRPCHVAISPDGKRALVTRDGDHLISVLAIEGRAVTLAGRDMTAGIAPYGSAISADGAYAVIANVGRVSGDSDTVSLIDLQATPPRVIETVTVGQTPEGITLSADGRLAAVVVMNGSNREKDSPLYNDGGKVLLYRVDRKRFEKVGEAPIGHWSQGAAFSPDGRTLLVQNMIEQDIMVFRIEGNAVMDTGHRLKVNGGPGAIRTADK